jgi:hypothetical protein
MNALFVIEFVISVLLVAFFATQIIAPMISGRPWFPILHQRRRAELELVEAKEDVEIAELEKLVEEIREEAQVVRTPKVEEPTNGKSSAHGESAPGSGS